MVNPSEEQLAAQLAAILDEGHRRDACWLLDDKCSARAWSELRKAMPDVINWFQVVHGPDFWLSVPRSFRLAFALISEQDRLEDDPEARARSTRALELLLRAVDEDKAAAIGRGRRRTP